MLTFNRHLTNTVLINAKDTDMDGPNLDRSRQCRQSGKASWRRWALKDVQEFEQAKTTGNSTPGMGSRGRKVRDYS